MKYKLCNSQFVILRFYLVCFDVSEAFLIMTTIRALLVYFLSRIVSYHLQKSL